jgi:hypothetical protein
LLSPWYPSINAVVAKVTAVIPIVHHPPIAVNTAFILLPNLVKALPNVEVFLATPSISAFKALRTS